MGSIHEKKSVEKSRDSDTATVKCVFFTVNKNSLFATRNQNGVSKQYLVIIVTGDDCLALIKV